MNVILYPPDYPQDTETGGFELENAVSLIRVQARDAALRRAHTRRIAGQNTSLNQGRLCGSKPFQMPLNQRGQQQAPTLPLLGTASWTAGGRGYSDSDTRRAQIYYFQSETAVTTSLYLSVTRLYLGAVNAPQAGYFAGGLGYKFYDVIEELPYVNPSIHVLGTKLSLERHAVAGFGSKLVGMFAGGAIFGYPSYRLTEELTYSTKLCVSLGNLLVQGRAAPHNGAANATNGFVFGGSGDLWTLAGAKTSVEVFSFSGKTFSLAGQSLSHAHQSHACFASALKAYIAGGLTAAWALSNQITAFVFSGQTNSIMGQTLVHDRCCSDGTGSSLAGYVLGGEGSDSSWHGTTTIDKVTYATETTSVPGAPLAQAVSDQGAVADYSSSWSHL